jgi:hypothetical protein
MILPGLDLTGLDSTRSYTTQKDTRYPTTAYTPNMPLTLAFALVAASLSVTGRHRPGLTRSTHSFSRSRACFSSSARTLPSSSALTLTLLLLLPDLEHELNTNPNVECLNALSPFLFAYRFAG